MPMVFPTRTARPNATPSTLSRLPESRSVRGLVNPLSHQRGDPFDSNSVGRRLRYLLEPSYSSSQGETMNV